MFKTRKYNLFPLLFYDFLYPTVHGFLSDPATLAGRQGLRLGEDSACKVGELLVLFHHLSSPSCSLLKRRAEGEHRGAGALFSSVGVDHARGIALEDQMEYSRAACQVGVAS